MESTWRSLLITGGLGFVGSHLAAAIAAKYPRLKISVLDQENQSEEAKQKISRLNQFSNIRIFYGDVRSVDLLRLLMERTQCDSVIHLAGVTNCTIEASLEFTKTNTIGTHIVLELCHHLKVGKFILISTDAVYGTIVEPEMGEEGRVVLNPSSCYAAAHAAAEMMTRAYHTSYGLNCNIVRMSNVYGPMQGPEKIVSNFILSILNDLEILIHGDGTSQRNYLYVEDAVAALDLVLHKGDPGKVYNANASSSSSRLDVVRVLKDICEVMGIDFGAIQWKSTHDRPFNDLRRCVVDPKMAALGWKQQVSWMEGLKATVEWYKANADQNWGGRAQVIKRLKEHSQHMQNA